MRHSVLLALAAFITANGCTPHVAMRVLEPAAVNIPAEVQTVAVIDRSRASNAGQTVLGVLEGAVTGEGIAADNEGRLEAISALTAVLAESPRFEVITPTVSPKEVDSNLFDKPWDHKGVVKLCKQHGCDGVIALEAFDSDSNIRSGILASDDPKYSAENATHWAERETRVVTSWRFYDVSADRHLDQLRDHDEASTWDEQALTIKDAIAALPDQQETIRRMGNRSGYSYGHRIAPAYITVTRSYYGGGSDEMKRARDHVRATDWEGATPIWREIAQNTTDTKLRGKAYYNLAVAAEVAGQLEKAHNLAKKAAVDLHNGRARSYARALEIRIAKAARLEQQLTPPPEEAPPVKPAPSSAPAPAGTPASTKPAAGTPATTKPSGPTDGGGVSR